MSGLDERLSQLSREERALLFERLRKRAPQAERPETGGAVIARRPADAPPPPLSFAQQRLWFLDRLTPGDASYNVATQIAIAGALSPAALRAALQAVGARHEALRTTFVVAGAGPVQRIAAEPRVPLPLLDLGGLADGQRSRELERLARDESRRPFDLAAGPLLRAALLRLAADDHVLLLTLHHIVSDGWSMGVLIREMGALYGGRSAPLPELPIQYADFALWQRRWLAGEVLAAQIAYWRQRLAGAPAALPLPTDRPRPPLRRPAGARRELRVERGAARLKELARELGATPFILLLAVFQALLRRYTGEDDLAVGTPVANRNRAETRGLIGFFVNTLVLRGDLSGNPTFRELAGRLRGVALDAYAHQDLPFEKLVEEVKPERDPSRSPLFQVMLVLQNAPMPELALASLHLSVLSLMDTPAKLDLTLSLAETPTAEAGYAGALTYSTDLFDATTIERFGRHFCALLAAAVREPGRRLAELPLFAAAEAAQLLREWNDTAAAPAPPLVPALFARAALLHAERPAVQSEALSLTYAELAARAGRLARHLAGLGVGPEVRVAMCVERSPGMVVGLLAVLLAGGAYVPLDPALPPERLAALLAEAAAPLLLTEERFLSRLPVAGPKIVLLDDPPPLSAAPLQAPDPASAAYVLFTSGSTGRPKGVVVEHRQLASYVAAIAGRLDLPPGASYAMVSTFAADLGNTVLFPALVGGGLLHLISPERALDPEALSEYAARHPIDCMKIVPSHLSALLRAARPEQVLPRQLLVLGGEAATAELVLRVHQLAPGCRLLNHYGPTETTVGVTTQPLAVGRPAPQRLGRPLDRVRIHLLGRHGEAVPLGAWGELCVGGASVARGYLGRPELTAARFVPDPLADDGGATGEVGGRLYRTGDLARRLPDGTLEIAGRTDDQVKIRGFRIEPGEVEAVLAAQPEIAAAAVLVRRSAEADPALVAFVVPREAAGEANGELHEALRSRLARALPPSMLPAQLLLLDTLPLTANGKLDRQALLRRAAEAGPADGAATAQYAAPRNEVERTLGEIWTAALGVPRVGVLDNFFDLGGHSLLLTEVQAQIRRRLGRELPLLKLFEHPTIGALAAHLAGGGEVERAGEGQDDSQERARRQLEGLELQRQRLAAHRRPLE